jgi:hypothetical protein
MSVQLVVFPQTYQGYIYTNQITQQYVADNTVFNSVGTGASNFVLTSTQTATNAVNSVAPNTNWRKFNYTGQTAPTLLTPGTAGIFGLRLTGQNQQGRQTGVYQLITGLVPGNWYSLTMNLYYVPSGTRGTLKIGENSMGNNLGGITPFISLANTGWTAPTLFQAQSTQEVLCLIYEHKLQERLDIQEIRLENATPIYTDPNDGQVIVDLYEEEEIPLTLSVDNFKNTSEKTQSYSKNFNLPATKRNNRIFGNIFDITRTADAYSFNPYVQTKARLKENGIDIFSGFLRLIDIRTKDGEISYNINLYSEAIAMADILKTKTFADLDFTELTHQYDRTNIQQSWFNQIVLDFPLAAGSFAGAAGATTTDVVKYPFCDWTGTLNLVASTNQVANGATSGEPSINKLEDAYRPWIRVKYLIDRIFAEAGFTYTSNHFNSNDFKRLFMDFNWGNDAAPNDWTAAGLILQFQASPHPYAANPLGTYSVVTFPEGAFPSQAGWDNSTMTFTAQFNNSQYNLTYKIDIEFVLGATCNIEWFDSTGQVYDPATFTNTAGNWVTYQGSISVLLQATQTLYCRISSSVANSVRPKAGFSLQTGITQVRTWGVVTSDQVTSGTLLNTLRGELGQWEFLKGIMTMFNLVAIPDKTTPTNIIIEPYNDIFINNPDSVQHDWTAKIDARSKKVEPLDLERRTVFKYEEDDEDYPFKIYKNATGQYDYGSLNLVQSQYTLLTGENEIIATPFAATVMKPMFDTIPDFVAPVIYGSNDKGTEFEGIENKPRILYDVSGSVPYDLQTNSYFTPAQNGVSGANATAYSLFSHTTDMPSTSTSTDFNFGECQLIGIGVAGQDNLYQTYYARYFSELYNPDTRVMSCKVLLTAKDLSEFNFFDTVLIKNREYRVNKIQYKPGELARVEFILIP